MTAAFSVRSIKQLSDQGNGTLFYEGGHNLSWAAGRIKEKVQAQYGEVKSQGAVYDFISAVFGELRG